MKLITEVYDQDIQLVTEAKEGGGKNYFIEVITFFKNNFFIFYSDTSI